MLEPLNRVDFGHRRRRRALEPRRPIDAQCLLPAAQAYVLFQFSKARIRTGPDTPDNFVNEVR